MLGDVLLQFLQLKVGSWDGSSGTHMRLGDIRMSYAPSFLRCEVLGYHPFFFHDGVLPPCIFRVFFKQYGWMGCKEAAIISSVVGGSVPISVAIQIIIRFGAPWIAPQPLDALRMVAWTDKHSDRIIDYGG